VGSNLRARKAAVQRYAVEKGLIHGLNSTETQQHGVQEEAFIGDETD
jgi:hypothetical protein